MNLPGEPMDLLVCGHRTSGRRLDCPRGAVNFGPRDNRGQSPNQSVHSNESDSEGHQPELSAAATTRITRLSSKKARSRMRKTRPLVHSSASDVDELEADSNRSSATKVIRALNSGFTPSARKQLEPSAPPTDLGIRALRSGGQIGKETDLKKVFRLYTQTAVNCSGKWDLGAMAEADKPNSLADAAEPGRKVARGMPIIDSSIDGELDRLHGEVNQSRPPTTTPSPPKSPPLLAPNPSHNLASEASEQLQVRTSAEHLLMLASGAQLPADTSATQVGRLSRSHSPSNLCADDGLVYMAAADAGRILDLATSF